jgi:proline iminopeptidase
MKTRLIILVLFIVCFSCGRQTKKVGSSGVIKIDGIELSYVTEGTRLPCLFYGISQYQQKSFSANIKNHFRCTFVDCRFNVPSAVADTLNPFNIEAAVEEIDSIRKTLNLPKFVLVGHSILGIIALRYAQKYPQNISHVVAIGTIPEISQNWTIHANNYWNDSASTERKEIFKNNWAKLTDDSLSKLSPSDAFIASVVANAPKRWHDSKYNEGKLLSGVTYNVPVLNQLFDQEFFLFADSVKIKPPVFLAMGKYDFGCPYYDWEKHLKMFNDITFQLFDYSGHNPHTEEADKFDSLVIDWIKKK